MKLFLALVVLYPQLAFSAPGARVACLGRGSGRTVYLEANLLSPDQLEHVALRVFSGQELRDQRDRMDGVRDASEISPLLGTRFYFHSGNTSTFLRLPDSARAGVRALLAASERQIRDAMADPRFSFPLDYVTEGYERGGDREITALRCGPKAADDNN